MSKKSNTDSKILEIKLQGHAAGILNQVVEFLKMFRICNPCRKIRVIQVCLHFQKLFHLCGCEWLGAAIKK